ncbi:xylose isomerase [Monoraphidium neglectum]|uniref:Xylose isomerase n=1 Tax=Monoraphidium neglectum TaxID=145388 RepID=A0A0D2J283_9CHLO|nr:xylose isomerase [Monoraphidium neglectum]KIY94097.1 xylose isomerase [Monoraphidium neglectum]|eukprot:XP_013893117.1 xylose isomerase [Monoraphidium neglectum]
MAARRDLADSAAAHGGGAGLGSRGGGGDGVLGWVARQGLVEGLGLVYFNYPQHLEGMDPDEVKRALSTAGLAAGGVALRFPGRFRAGALTNPDAALRAEALALALGACGWARDLGASEVVVWSAFDGYDYHMQGRGERQRAAPGGASGTPLIARPPAGPQRSAAQQCRRLAALADAGATWRDLMHARSSADYDLAWRRLAEGLSALADGCGPRVNVSLEWKPTDPSSRFSFVPSTAAALLLAREVNRPSFGLTLDTGHMLMAGENPAHSAAMVAAAGKLFGMHLNDGHSRVGAEDGLIFGSVHPAAALELVYWLRRVGYGGAVYFDTFPVNEDPVREAELNIRRFKQLWARAAQLDEAGIAAALLRHDSLGAMGLIDQEGVTGAAGPLQALAAASSGGPRALNRGVQSNTAEATVSRDEL